MKQQNGMQFQYTCIGIMIMLVLMMGLYGEGDWITVWSEELTVSRQEIQDYFIRHSGNSTRAAHWQDSYQGKRVAWEGVVYKIKRHPKSHRVEIMVKVLENALLYDTIVILEGNTTLNPAIQKDVKIAFHGKIFHGVDALGVKQVRVLAPHPQAVQLKPLTSQ